MIDFRYHLVSIASVFLALAVGIVLGAGPLKGTIGDTLTAEVTKLREDANDLRAELSAAEASVTERDDIVTGLRPRAVAGLLGGQSLSILVLPGAAEATVEETRTTLTDAGGIIATDVQLDPAWSSTDPPAVADRTAAAAELRELFTTELPVGASADDVLAVALGWALMTAPAPESAESTPSPSPEASADTPDAAGPEGTDGGTDAATGEPTEPSTDGLEAASENFVATETSRRILELLDTYGLISEDSAVTLGAAEGVVVIAPESDDATAEDIAGWGRLVAALDEVGPATVAGDVAAEVTIETNVIATIRDDGTLNDAVSTLDNLSTPVGLTALAFVVAEQVEGTAGHYGELDSAAQLFPPVPPRSP